MSYYLYIPTQPTAAIDAAAILEEYNIADLVRESGGDAMQCAIALEGTPDGKKGVVITWGQSATKTGGVQWHKTKTTPEYWIGIRESIKPEDIRRERVLESVPVKLNDDQEWLIPVARFLPYSYTLNDQGEPVPVVRKKYREFCDKTMQYAMAFREAVHESQSEGKPFVLEITVSEAFAYGLMALGFNYYVNAEIVSLLELTGSECFVSLLAAASYQPQEGDDKKKDMSSK